MFCFRIARSRHARRTHVLRHLRVSVPLALSLSYILHIGASFSFSIFDDRWESGSGALGGSTFYCVEFTVNKLSVERVFSLYIRCWYAFSFHSLRICGSLFGGPEKELRRCATYFFNYNRSLCCNIVCCENYYWQRFCHSRSYYGWRLL